jgi:AcrR family transcriptional regulator
VSDPRRSVREELRDVRARHILDAAQELLLAKGYRDASMDEIALRAGVAKGTLYQHFGHKDDLVLALFDRHLARFEQTVQEAAATDLPARERLERILRYVYSDPGGAYGMIELLTRNVEIGRALAPRKGEAFERMERATSGIALILEAGRRDGSLDPTMPTGLMVSAFMNALTLGRPDPRFGLEGLAPDELAEQVCRALFEGIGGLRTLEG